MLPSDFTLKLGYSPIEVHHALFQIFAKPAHVQIFGRVGGIVVLQLPLAECPREARACLTERGPLPWVLSPGALHQIVQLRPAVGGHLRAGTIRDTPDYLTTR